VSSGLTSLTSATVVVQISGIACGGCPMMGQLHFRFGRGGQIEELSCYYRSSSGDAT